MSEFGQGVKPLKYMMIALAGMCGHGAVSAGLSGARRAGV